ncbi:unnamed protein product [Allacma fusca]|uniref:Uncharacterized protein n=1 Tax=Allacma fusca TaxID=39272 RepID=A0A8J2NZK7_9HEXA|nr:unnamed protein product [Allacma fusca]
MAEEEEEGYRWETGYEKTWEAIEEDADGFLDSAVAEIIEKGKRKRLEQRRATGRVCLGIMRHVYLIVDLSKCMLDQDLKPNRILATVKVGIYSVKQLIQLNDIESRPIALV